MAKNQSKRFKSLWKKESNKKNALFVDISVDPNGFPLETLYNISNEKKPASKDNKQSLEFRNKGNVAFGQRKWREAMEFYNKSLCFAELGSENMSLAFGNRSSCFFSLKMFSKCLVDIDLATKANCPERLIEKLEKRKNDCLGLIDKGAEFVPFEPKLSFPSYEMFPSMANVLQIDCNKKFGRYIKTRADIAVGDTVMIEKAYVSKVITQRNMRCNTCYRLDVNLLPCQKCTEDMFCYDGCEQSEFHQIECNMKTMDQFKDVSCFHLLIIRSILIAIKTIPNVEELMKFVETTIASDPFEIPESEPIDAVSKYRTFLKLSMDSKIENDLFNWRVFFINKTLLNHSDIKALFVTAEHKRFLMHLVGHHSGIIHYNARASIQTYGTTYTTELQPLIASYFNHSCAPNVATVSSDDRVVAVAIRPIKKGEQLFISYFGRDLHRDTASRQRHFSQFFEFVCKCERCTSTTPFFPLVNSYDFEWIQCVLRGHNVQFDFNDEVNVNFFLNKCAEYARKYGGRFWTDEVSLVMNCFVHMLEFKFKHKLTF